MKLVAALALFAVAGVVSHEPTPRVELVRGASGEAVVEFRIAEGNHVQANPAAREFLIPTSLELEDGCGVTAGTPVYPPAIAFRLEGTENDLAVWDGTFRILVPLRAHRFARRRDCALHGTLTYQACDLRTCFPPASVGVELPLRIR